MSEWVGVHYDGASHGGAVLLCAVRWSSVIAQVCIHFFVVLCNRDPCDDNITFVVTYS